MQNRAGKTVSNLSKDMTYISFCPNPLPPEPNIVIDNEMYQLLVNAYKYIAYLNVFSNNIRNIDLFISMYVRKEALLSSQIEGTQCTIEDIFNPEIDENVNADVSDVINYVKALNYAIKRLEELPLCNRLIKETHAILMNNVRGQDKSPGEFRLSQNWIGGANSTIKNARYIPPNQEDMEKGMADIEKYMNDEDDLLDPLIKTALIHYQFETIHPFLDGNGRIGRLLITLYLINQKVLESPILYLSCFLKLNRIEYYDRMDAIRKDGNYEQWIKFFLKGVEETARDATETIYSLIRLHRLNLSKLSDLSSSTKENSQALFNYIESNPIIDTSKTAVALKLSRNAVAKYISILCDKGILKPYKKSGKAQIYIYEDYLSILRKDTI